MPAPINRQVLEEAAEWLMRLSEGDLSPSQQDEWEQWRSSSPERHHAWARAQVLQGKLGGLPRSLAMSALTAQATRPDAAHWPNWRRCWR